MGKRSRELKTGLTEEERIAKPKGNDKTLNAMRTRKEMNKYIKAWNNYKRHIRVGRART